MRFSKISLVAVAFLALSGCVGLVETKVDAYSSIPDDLSTKTVFISAYNKSDAQSLEWRTNAQILKNVIEEKGFSVVPTRQHARLVAYFGFAVDNGERVTTNYSIPNWGVTGYSGANTYGTIYGNTYSANTTLTPTYGVTGYTRGTRTDTIFTRSASLEMIDTQTKKKVFEGTAISSGSCNSFAPVASSIIKAVLSNFPKGKNGRVNLPMEGEC